MPLTTGGSQHNEVRPLFSVHNKQKIVLKRRTGNQNSSILIPFSIGIYTTTLFKVFDQHMAI
jgi:hypothetical protein